MDTNLNDPTPLPSRFKRCSSLCVGTRESEDDDALDHTDCPTPEDGAAVAEAIGNALAVKHPEEQPCDHTMRRFEFENSTEGAFMICSGCGERMRPATDEECSDAADGVIF
jgi:hypothetical protein